MVLGGGSKYLCNSNIAKCKVQCANVHVMQRWRAMHSAPPQSWNENVIWIGPPTKRLVQATF